MLSLPAIFSDHMVFQREKNILLWGESDEKNVTAVIDEKKVSSDVNNGRWEIELPPMAAGGPYELEVSDGVQTKKYTDIMIGEVWLAGGQSNMELELQNSMNGQEVYKFAVRTVPKAISEALTKANVSEDEVSIYLLHQANLRIIESVAKRLHQPMEKFPTNLEECGNVSAASVPILLDKVRKDGMIGKGDKIVLAGFGAGLTWGACVIEW